MEPLILNNLTCGYHGHPPVLRNINATLHRGCMTVLLGANGIGKSTLLRTICRIQPSLGGEIILEGKPLGSMTPRELSRIISIVNTDHTGTGGLTVSELVGLGRHPFTGFFGRLSRHDRDIVSEALRSVGMDHRKNDFVANLSDGMRQKVMIARALAQTTPVIILDEPTAFLDAASRIETLRLLRNLAVTQNKAILISTHDIGQVLPLAADLWMINREHEFIAGKTEQLTGDPSLMDTLFQNPDIKFDTVRQDFL